MAEQPADPLVGWIDGGPHREGTGRAVWRRWTRREEIRTELITDWAGLESLEKGWNALLTRSEADTIFLRWEWVRSWAKIHKKTFRPFIVTVRDEDGTLTGIAPFYMSELLFGGILRYRTLRVIGDHATGMEYPDWIVRRDVGTAATGEIAKALALRSRLWDCIWMPKMASWTGAADRIVQPCKEEGFYCRVRPREFAILDLPRSVTEYKNTLSKNKREDLRAESKRIADRNGSSIRQCRNAEELPRFLESLFDLHGRRWRVKNDSGTFVRKPEEALFYQEFAPVALERGWLRIFGLEDHGEIKAIQIGYVYNNVFHGLQGGFDPCYLKGVRDYLWFKTIEDCITTGLEAYDFLSEMTDYKRRWLAKVRMGCDLFIGNRNFMTRLLFINNVWPTGRFLRPPHPSYTEGKRNQQA